MRLDYQILWFEDQKNNVEEVAKGLSTRLSRLGFSLKVQWIKPGSDLNNTFGNIKNIVNNFDESYLLRVIDKLVERPIVVEQNIDGKPFFKSVAQPISKEQEKRQWILDQVNGRGRG